MSVDIVTHLGEAFCFDDLEGEARGISWNPGQGRDTVYALSDEKKPQCE